MLFKYRIEHIGLLQEGIPVIAEITTSNLPIILVLESDCGGTLYWSNPHDFEDPCYDDSVISWEFIPNLVIKTIGE